MWGGGGGGAWWTPLAHRLNVCTIILKHTIFRVKCPPSTWQIGHNYIGKTKLEGLVGVEFPASKFFARMNWIQDELWYAVKAVVIACVYDNASKMAIMWSTVTNNKLQRPQDLHTQKKSKQRNRKAVYPVNCENIPILWAITCPCLSYLMHSHTSSYRMRWTFMLHNPAERNCQFTALSSWLPRSDCLSKEWSLGEIEWQVGGGNSEDNVVNFLPKRIQRKLIRRTTGRSAVL